MRRGSVRQSRGPQVVDPWQQAIKMIEAREKEIRGYNDAGANELVGRIMTNVQKISNGPEGLKALAEQHGLLLSIREELKAKAGQTVAASAKAAPIASWTRIYGTEFKATLEGMGQVMNETSGPVGAFPMSAGKSEIRIITGEGEAKSTAVQTMKLESGAQLVAIATEEVHGGRERYANNVEVTLTNKNGITTADMANATAVLSKIVQDRGGIKVDLNLNNVERANKVVADTLGPAGLAQKEVASVEMAFVGASANNVADVMKALEASNKGDNNLKGGIYPNDDTYRVASKDGGYSIEVNYSRADDKATVNINAAPGQEEKAMNSAVKMMSNVDQHTPDVNKEVKVTAGSQKAAMESKLDDHALLNKVNTANIKY